MTRLEIAAGVFAGFATWDPEKLNKEYPSFELMSDQALLWADKLIAREAMTRKCETCVKLLADPMWKSGDRLQCPYCGTMTVKA